MLPKDEGEGSKIRSQQNTHALKGASEDIFMHPYADLVISLHKYPCSNSLFHSGVILI